MKVITAVVNNPTFIEIQYHTLKKYLKGVEGVALEFIVFNDAKPFPDETNGGDLSLVTQIEETCKALQIQCIPIPNSHHVSMGIAHRHADTFNNHITPYQLANPDQYLLLDSDMFLIDYLDMNIYFKYACAVLLQSRHGINYIWPGLCYLDFTKIKAPHLLNWSLCENGDTGALTAEWLKEQIGEGVMPSTDDLRWKQNETYHTDTIYFIPHLWSTTWDASELPENLKPQQELLTFFQEDPRNSNGKFYCEIYDKVFLHYRAGSNHNKEGMHLHQALTQRLKQILL